MRRRANALSRGRDEHERQILIVAHAPTTTGTRMPRCSCADLICDAHEHVAPQHVVVVRHDDAHRHRLRARIGERRDVVHASRQSARGLTSVMTSDRLRRRRRRCRSFANTFAITHIVLRSAIVKHGVRPGLQQLAIGDELLDDRAVDRRADDRLDRRAVLPVAHGLDLRFLDAERAHVLHRGFDVGVGRREIGLRLLELARAPARRS